MNTCASLDERCAVCMVNVPQLLLSSRFSHLLKEVDELAHVALVARGAEDVLLEGALLVQLEQHHLQAILELKGGPSGRIDGLG